MTWTLRSAMGPPMWYALATNGSRVVVLGDNGGNAAARYSDNGTTTWTVATISSTDAFRGAEWCDRLGLFVAVGENGATAYSADGATWTVTAGPAAMSGGVLTSVRWSGLRAVACGYKSSGVPVVMVSIDGITWTLIDLEATAFSGNRPSAVVWTGAAWFIAAAKNGSPAVGRFWTSLDGLSWTGISAGTTSGGYVWGWGGAARIDHAVVTVGIASSSGLEAFGLSLTF